MIKFNTKQNRILSIFLATSGVFLIGSGLIMNTQKKEVVYTKYKVTVSMKNDNGIQEKIEEIKLKDIEIEINNPLSVDIKDYLVNSDEINDSTLKALKLDTSLVNINQAGSYKYTIYYNKKKYIGNIKVKEKELPNFTLTLKTIKVETKHIISGDPKVFIEGEIPDEVYKNLKLDTSKVDTQNQGDYTYYITYNGVTYQGKVEVRDPSPIKQTEQEEKKEEETTDSNEVEVTNPTENVQ